ncbi:MAG TPA: helix-turn-helix domain-containing protein [bacterium]|nr:helix-turn-helix domain-containing protein [bacterium]
MAELHPTRKRIIRLIRESGGITLSELRRHTGLSRSTLRQHLSIMTRDGLVAGQFVRQRTGRPPLVYRLTPRAELAPPQTYAAFLRALFAGMADRARIEAVFEQMGAHLAAQHPEIRRMPDVAARLEAARRIFFPDAESTAAERTADGYQFSLYTCPLASVSMEFKDLCCMARGTLARMTGAEVGQTEWIVRGDPRCTFEVRLPLPAKVKTA